MIAIIGTSCVLPGANSREELWELVRNGRSAIGPAPEGRWGMPRARSMGTLDEHADKTWSDSGGYVRGFEIDPEGFAGIPAATVKGLDPLFQWSMHGVREALRDAKHRGDARTGLVMGNLSFPSVNGARYSERRWLEANGMAELADQLGLADVDPQNRFGSGLPAILAARANGLGAGFSLDAACASSLYAIKIACDRLHDGDMDVMVAGAVNRADDLFIHIGFCALAAMSRTGQSRPFHRDADGLVPGEGAAFVVLKRLADAEAAGDRILGVIRGVGLSNDGRGRGMLAPSEEGQLRALRIAYDQAGVRPADIGLLECHATGTVVGDAAEINSTGELFTGLKGVPLGSLKSNLGHLITVAGTAALIKVLSAFEHRIRPPTLSAELPNPALADSPFRLLQQAEPWEGPLRAGISAFGFGGNNAHLVVEAYAKGTHPLGHGRAPRVKAAIVAMGARVGRGDSATDWTRRHLTGADPLNPRIEVTVELAGLRSPPKDLQRTLPQQLMILEAAREAAGQVTLGRERTAVLVGMGVDPEIARYGARWRIPGWGDRLGNTAWGESARDAFEDRLEASGVIGTMPNIPANRISSQLDLAGPGFTISEEEVSGTEALRIALRALSADEIDAAVVGAVDLSCEPVHTAAVAKLGGSRPAADAAVAIVIKRLADAVKAGDPVLAVLDGVESHPPREGHGAPGAFAAISLLDVVAAAIEVSHAARPSANGPQPWVGNRETTAGATSMFGPAHEVAVRAGPQAQAFVVESDFPQIRAWAAADRSSLASVIGSTRTGSGSTRIAVIAPAAQLLDRIAAAKAWVAAGATGAAPDGVVYSDRALTESPDGPIPGLAFVFAPAGAAYSTDTRGGMARELCLLLPELADRLGKRTHRLLDAIGWAWRGERPAHPLDQLWGASAVCQLHWELTHGLLGLIPSQVFGLSSGESNALLATGAWGDADAFVEAISASDVFRKSLVAPFDAVTEYRDALGSSASGWGSVAVQAPLETIRAAIAAETEANGAFVHLAIIHAPGDAVISGEPSAVARVVAALAVPAVQVDYPLAAHVPELGVVAGPWRELHRREIAAPQGIRFHLAGAQDGPIDTDVVADAITRQAVGTVDFPAVVERAYAAGARVFVEHGPRGLCSGWIRKILGDRPHVAISLDRNGRSPIRGLLTAIGELFVAGLPIDIEGFMARLPAPRALPQAVLRLPAHPKEVKLPPFTAAVAPVQIMKRAPALPAILGAFAPPHVGAGVAPAHSPHVAASGRGAAGTAAPAMAASGVSMQVIEADPLGSGPWDEVIGEAARIHAHVAAVHEDYVATGSAVHAAFLEHRARMAQGLLQSYGSSPPSAPLPLPMPLPETARQARFEPVVAPVAAPATSAAIVVDSREGKGKGKGKGRGEGEGLPGPKFDRDQLVILSGGRISDVFGPAFKGQDGFHRQVRMPEPPLLLADRVTGIDAEPLSMKTGTMWTETDVKADSWYLNEGRMPAGVHIESGQADLLLISWLGVDFLNKSERIYRLLGCELTWHEGKDGKGTLPQVGDTLVYDIHLDGHAKHGDVRLMFFHYDCRIDGIPRLSVRSGQAGFFTEAELGESGGILWTPEEGEHSDDGPLDAPVLQLDRNAFSREQLEAFAAGRPWDCFGAAWWPTKAHVRTPRIQTGRMLFLDHVVECSPRGGPWKRGYLRAEQPIHQNDWFFDGHFHNDPCMPGTLMFEGCVQAMAVFMSALGVTVDRDGWRFEPVPEHKYLMRCRGQVTPTSKNLTYEIFVEEFVAGPIPMLFADLLCTVDGLKAFHARKVGLRLVPSWPLDAWRFEPIKPPVQVHGGDGTTDLRSQGGLAGLVEPKPVAISPEGFPYGWESLVACAWGRPSEAFGPIYKRFDSERRVARLPGPPYHFMSRITRLDIEQGAMKAGGSVEVEYDIPRDVWYFDENGAPSMPFCVLMEAALQPCGWLASYVGSALGGDIDLMFRNLDGTGKLLAEITPHSGVLRTVAKITSISKSSGMIIESFEVECFVGSAKVYTMKTVFGFFPKEAFDNQVGLVPNDAERARIEAPANFALDLRAEPPEYFAGTARLANPMLCMLDRVIGWEPAGGARSLGYARAEKDVNPGEWFFKAHFFQDPVQPGSLGVEALCQLIQWTMLAKGLHEGMENPRFEPVAVDREVTWKYRGQVVPKNKVITSEIEITKIEDDARGRVAVADGALWVDGKRIYMLKNLAIRLVSDPAAKPRQKPQVGEVLDPNGFVSDHRPTWTIPALPAMSMVDRLAGAVPGPIRELRDVQVKRWLTVPAPIRLQTRVDGDHVVLEAWRAAKTEALSRFEPVCEGIVIQGAPAPAPEAWPRLSGPVEPDPYASGALFHGPAFQALTELVMTAEGSSGTIDAAKCTVPRGTLNQGILDVITHAIPHDSFSRWSSDIAEDLVAYPWRIPVIRFHGRIPDAGTLRVEVRFRGFDDAEKRLPKVEAQLIGQQGVLVSLELVEILLPKGPLGTRPREERLAFLRDRRFVEGVALSTLNPGATTADAATVKGSDWLPGNVAAIYAAEGDLLASVAAKDHIGQRLRQHPSRIDVHGGSAIPQILPLRRFPLEFTTDAHGVTVRDATIPTSLTPAPAVLDITPVRTYWDRKFAIGRWPVEDLYYGLVETFVNDVVIADPDAWKAIHGRSALYLGNHQVGVESLLFSILASGLSGVSTVTLAKAEHRTTWLGKLIQHCFTWPGVKDPQVITFFDREDKPSLMRIIGEIAQEMQTVGKSAMVHVEGTRSLAAGIPIQKMSSAFIDMALAIGAPIVPVRFYGALPREEMPARIEFPVGLGRQDVFLGRPILPEQLTALPLKERKQFVIDAMNHLGPAQADEQPYPGNPALEAAVEAWIARTGATHEHAVLGCILATAKSPSEPVQRLLDGLRTGKVDLGDSAEDRWLAELGRRIYGPKGPKIA